MSKDLKAENLSICLPNFGCNKNCEYCISKMTKSVPKNTRDITRNFKKVQKIAELAEVTSILVTSQGEPLLSNSFLVDYIYKIGEMFAEWPLEIQTNGLNLESYIKTLYDNNFNTIAISMDEPKQFETYKQKIKQINDTGMIVRLTVNITDKLKDYNFEKIIQYCNDNNVRQLMIRNIVSPLCTDNSPQTKWIQKHVPLNQYPKIIAEFHKLKEVYGFQLLRNLTHGLQIWDVFGISFAHSDYCLQEINEGNNIRSLIFREDGHLYTSWNSLASIIF